VFGQELKDLLFMVIDIRALILGKSKKEDQPQALPIRDDGANAAALASRSRADPLLQKDSTQSGIHQSSLDFADGNAQRMIRNPFGPGPASEPSGFECPNHNIYYLVV
jgi:hypothetical protein